MEAKMEYVVHKLSRHEFYTFILRLEILETQHEERRRRRPARRKLGTGENQQHVSMRNAGEH